VLLNKKILFSGIIIFIVFLLDRISKILILNFFSKNQLDDYYVNYFLNLILVWNQGIAFGLFQSESLIYHLLSIVIAIVIAFVIYLIYISKKKYEIFFYALITGGAIGNLFDRLYFGAVPDFIDLHYKNFHWFTFNVSDIWITIGIIGILIFDLFKLENKDNEKNT
jgi:signal peptidase II|tara:strand:+ start:167 stop:664 length:498 start_codon:yes stop_codon:yes gene_type:complete